MNINDLHVVLYVDCTKMGVLSQIEVNNIGAMAEKVLGQNPQRFLVLLHPMLTHLLYEPCISFSLCFISFYYLRLGVGFDSTTPGGKRCRWLPLSRHEVCFQCDIMVGAV